MKARVEVTKNSEGRIESGKLFYGKRQIDFTQEWDDSGFLRQIEFDGKGDLPSPSEMLRIINAQFMERIRKIDDIDNIGNIDHIGLIDHVNVGDVWVRPSSASGIGWSYPERACDGILSTYAQGGAGAGEGTLYLTMVLPGSMPSNQLTIFLDVPITDTVDIDIYDGSAWTHVYTAVFSSGSGWLTVTYASQTVAQIRIQFGNNSAFFHTYLVKEALVGNVLIVRTLHDLATYKPKYTALAADGNLIAAVAGKVLKVHKIAVKATANMEGDVCDNDTPGDVVDHFKLNDREGDESPFLPYPAYLYKSDVGEPLYFDFSTAGATKFEIVYTDADAS